MPSLAVAFRRIAACCAGTALCLTLATSTGQPVARAEARDLLANAIANTQGSYLVYNFGGGHPAPMRNAAGSWYDGTSGGHLMIIKATSQRLEPHLLVDSHAKALEEGRAERIQAIDMGRRGLHNEGATLMRERLDGKIAITGEIDVAANREFTLAIAFASWNASEGKSLCGTEAGRPSLQRLRKSSVSGYSGLRTVGRTASVPGVWPILKKRACVIDSGLRYVLCGLSAVGE